MVFLAVLPTSPPLAAVVDGDDLTQIDLTKPALGDDECELPTIKAYAAPTPGPKAAAAATATTTVPAGAPASAPAPAPATSAPAPGGSAEAGAHRHHHKHRHEHRGSRGRSSAGEGAAKTAPAVCGEGERVCEQHEGAPHPRARFLFPLYPGAEGKKGECREVARGARAAHSCVWRDFREAEASW